MILKFTSNPENHGKHVYDLVWSGKFMPMVGDIVGTNSFGVATVTGFFTEDGFLGVELSPHDPPEWWIDQMERSGRDRTLRLFGAEIRALEVAA